MSAILPRGVSDSSHAFLRMWAMLPRVSAIPPGVSSILSSASPKQIHERVSDTPRSVGNCRMCRQYFVMCHRYFYRCVVYTLWYVSDTSVAVGGICDEIRGIGDTPVCRSLLLISQPLRREIISYGVVLDSDVGTP